MVRLTDIQHQKRIEANNHSGLKLRAVIEVAPYENVIKIAQQFDNMRTNGVCEHMM